MLFEWISQEHQRMHIIEEWPEGPQKQAALAGVRSKLQSLMRNCRWEEFPECVVCLSRQRAPAMAPVFQIDTYPNRRAA